MAAACHQKYSATNPKLESGTGLCPASDEDALNGVTDFDAWIGWIGSLDAAWLFAPILVCVIAVVGLWSRSLRRDKTRASEEEDVSRPWP